MLLLHCQLENQTEALHTLEVEMMGSKKHHHYRSKTEALIVAAAESNKIVMANKWKAGKMAERAKSVQ